MNLTIRTQLGAMLHKSSQLSGLMKSHSELSVECHEALESLNRSIAEGTKLQGFLSDLECAQGSLESLGFSDEWLGIVNKDGHFLKAINVDLSDLIGSLEDKAEVCMEGLWDTIKSIVVRIWKFICDLLSKIVTFIQKISLLFKLDSKNIEQSQKNLAEFARYCSGDKRAPKSPAEQAVILGKKVNDSRVNVSDPNTGYQSGAGGDKSYDIRDLLTRMNVDSIIAMSLLGITKSVFKDSSAIAGPFKTANELFTDDIIRYLGSNGNANYFFDTLGKSLKSDATAMQHASGLKMFGWNGFKLVTAYRDILKLAQQSGISVESDGVIITPLGDALSNIDYSTVYKTITDYQDVLSASGVHLMNCKDASYVVKKEAEIINAIAIDMRAYADKLSTELSVRKTKDSDFNTNPNMRNTPYQIRTITTWMQQTITSFARLESDINTCRMEVLLISKKINQSIEACKQEIANFNETV